MSEEQQPDEQGDQHEGQEEPENEQDQQDEPEQDEEQEGQGEQGSDKQDESEDEQSSATDDQGEQKESISAEDARKVLASNEAVAIDLRDEEEWRTGHVPGARRISPDELDDVDDLPDQKVIVVCEDGKQSAEVAEKLRSDGRDAVVLEGGMDEWRSDDLPMQPSHDPDEESPI